MLLIIYHSKNLFLISSSNASKSHKSSAMQRGFIKELNFTDLFFSIFNCNSNCSNQRYRTPFI